MVQAIFRSPPPTGTRFSTRTGTGTSTGGSSLRRAPKHENLELPKLIAFLFVFLQKITLTDIKNFEAQYRHSEEEMADLKQAYLDHDGDMALILESVPCCGDEDQER